MTYKHSIFSLFIILFLTTLVWVSYFFSHATPPLLIMKNHLPDVVMEEVSTLIFDADGNPKMQIQTPKMLHFATDDTTRLQTPYLTLYRHSAQPWFISSHYASAAKGIEKVNFWENVQVEHAEDEHSPNTTIKTATLTVYPNKKTAETADLITMIQPNLTVKAIGMFADMNKGDIKLLSQARGFYVPD